MLRAANAIDQMNTAVASIIRWLALVMVLVQFCIVIGRYVFGFNSIAAQESVLYMHATLFMLGAGFTLLVDKHVRVDVFLCQGDRGDTAPHRYLGPYLPADPFHDRPALLVVAFCAEFVEDP